MRKMENYNIIFESENIYYIKITELLVNDYLKMGKSYSLEEVKEEIMARDKADMEREISPLKPSDDSVIYYNDGNDIEKVLGELSILIN